MEYWPGNHHDRCHTTYRRHFLGCNRGEGVDRPPAPHRGGGPRENCRFRVARQRRRPGRQRPGPRGHPRRGFSQADYFTVAGCFRPSDVRRPDCCRRSATRAIPPFDQQRASRYCRRRSSSLQKGREWIPRPRCCCEALQAQQARHRRTSPDLAASARGGRPGPPGRKGYRSPRAKVPGSRSFICRERIKRPLPRAIRTSFFIPRQRPHGSALNRITDDGAARTQ